MKPRPFTIARLMGWIAVVSLNAALVRAFVVQEMFIGGIAMMMVLQIGLWCFLKSRGRPRRFWLGFEIAGTAAVLALFSCDFFPDSPWGRLVFSYLIFAYKLAFMHLPTPWSDYCDDHQDLLLVLFYFVPELIAGLLGGVICSAFFRSIRPADSINRQGATFPT